MSTFFEIYEPAWCPGCGNFEILTSLQSALGELELQAKDVVLVGGIGQAAKTPQYIDCNSFCGLHGRALPAAMGIKTANKELTVIVATGDGDSYSEGGNHFIHNIRRNIDITHFVHDNQIYGLTKGQASATSEKGMTAPVQPEGNYLEPLNPLLLAISAGCGFVARAFSGNGAQLTAIMKEAVKYKGYALVDIFQPCVTFNKLNTYAWYEKHIYDLPADYDPTDKLAAMAKVMETGDKIPVGILYREEKPVYEDIQPSLKGQPALVERKITSAQVQQSLAKYR